MSCYTRSLVLEDERRQVAFAEQVAAALSTSAVFFLQGDLGTGKTTFARGFIHASGFDGVVRSPTYTLVEPYPVSGNRTCYHFDLYRLAEAEELDYIGARDYFNETDVCLIEWPQKAAGFLPEPDWLCAFFYHDAGRMIEVTACTEKGNELMLQVFSD